MKQWQTVQIPLAAGLDTKADPRARPLPSFEILRDAEWEEAGGLQTRKPYASVGAALDGGGSLADVRRIVDHGGELLAFTRDKLYARIPHLNAWVERAEYLAIKVEESTHLATANDVRCADRAELDGVVVYTWQDGTGGWIAVVDADSGAELVPAQLLKPSYLGTPTQVHRPRCLALETRILVVGMASELTGGQTYATTIDPAAPAIGTAVALGAYEGASNFHFDVCRVRGQDRALVAMSSIPHDALITKGYRIARVDADLTFAATTKTTRVSDGPIAVACAPESVFALVLHANNTSEKVLADLLDIATLGDVPGEVDVELGAFGPSSPVSLTQVTAEFRTAPVSGQYRAYVFWTADERTDEDEWTSTTTWIDTAGNKGTAATFVRRLGIASRAFERDGRIYLWGAFAGASQFEPSSTVLRMQLQNSYFLYRDDATFHAKAVARAGGGLTYYRGHLPAVQDLGDERYVWAAVIRRVIPLNAGAATYDAGAIREVAFTFDSAEARRTARIGGTTYIAGGEVLQYDGRRLVELGFHVDPWHLFATNDLGDAANGTYAIKESWRWNNGAGERDRSASAIVGTFTITGGPHGIQSLLVPLCQTHKPDAYVEMWRTEADPTLDSPFFLTTSRDPADDGVGVPNGFVWNDPSAWSSATIDALADADLAEGEPHPANGGYIEGMAPPAATIIAASNDRLFLAGVAGDADRIWYTRHRADGEVAAFDGDLTVEVPRIGGPITGLGFLNDTLIVFRRHAVYALDGAGYDNLGGGVNYGPARLLASDVGAVVHESIALTPRGLVFKSAKGWYLVNRGWSLEYIGAPVAAFDDEDVLAVHVLEQQHQIRCVTPARVLVLDYSVPSEGSPYGQWSEWTIAGAVGALLCDGVHTIAFADDVRAQRSDYAGIDYGLEAKLAPIKLNELQGAGSVRWLDVLGEYRGACRLQVQLYRDYEATPYQTVQWAPTLTVVGGPLQVSVGPRIPKCMAIGVHLKAIAAEGDGAPTTEAIKLTGLALEVGIDKGINRRLPAGQKA